MARRLDRYLMFDAIASGGMGTVHLGRLVGTAGFRRVVAIKRIADLAHQDREIGRAFQREIALAGRLLHPNVVASLDVVKSMCASWLRPTPTCQ